MSAVMEQFSMTVDIYSHRRASPALSTAYTCVKIILLITNLIFMIFGCVLIGVGSYALNSEANSIVGQTLPSGLIVMGVFVLVLAVLGAVSAWKESTIGLAVYLSLLLIITIILFSIGIAIVVNADKAGQYIQEAWYAASDDLKTPVQNALDCCGLMSVNDSAALPCPHTVLGNSTGCYDQLLSSFEKAYSHAGATGIAFSLIMGFGIGFVICLLRGIRTKQNEANLEKIRASNNGGQPNDFDGIEAGAASMFDREGYAPEVTQSRRK